MKKNIRYFSIALLVCFSACKENTDKKNKQVTQTPELLSPWEGPYQGVPAFDEMQVSMLKPAIRKGMERHLKELDSITHNTKAPTFENTIIPMEKAGSALDRAFTYYGIYSSNLSSEKFRKIQKELAPEISSYESKILQNEALFQRIKSVYKKSQQDSLSDQKQRALNLIYERFVMNGVNLSEEDKKRYATIEQELSKLYTKFSTNVLAEEENYVVFLNKEQLEGLPVSFQKASASAAESLGKKGEFAITNTRSSMDPFLTYSDNRELREKVWKNYYSRGDNNDEFDNKSVIKQILKLRD